MELRRRRAKSRGAGESGSYPMERPESPEAPTPGAIFPHAPAVAPPSGFDAYAPGEIAERIETVGVAKARLPLLSMAMLGVLAGGFIGLGGLYFTIVTSDPTLGFAAGRVLGGVGFSLGLFLVVVAGAELFTGNVLLVIAWVSRRITTRDLVRSLLVVYAANFVVAVGLAVLVVLSGHGQMGGGWVGRTAVTIAASKASLPFAEAFFRGILCNVLVCLAVWLALAGRSVVDKLAAVVLPISAFVAAGFEHSIANMYFIPLGLLLRPQVETQTIAQIDALTWAGLVRNLVPVTLGNIVGGGVMVALVYYLVYRRNPPPASRAAGDSVHVSSARTTEKGRVGYPPAVARTLVARCPTDGNAPGGHDEGSPQARP